MATTSTSDSTPWTSRRVRDRRVVAGGAWLTITIIPSNAQFEHRLGPDGSVKIGRVVWPRHWCGPGDGGRTGHPVASAMVEVGALDVLSVTPRSGTARQWGTRSPARTAR